MPVLLVLLCACARAPRAPAFATDSTRTDDRLAACSDSATAGPECAQASLTTVQRRLAYLGLAAAALLVLAGVAWFIRVRAEVRALEQPAFLVLPPLDVAALPIAGAEQQGPGLGRQLVPGGWMAAIPPPAFAALPTVSLPRVPDPGVGAAPGSQPLVFSAGTARSAEEPVQAADATLQFLPGRLVHAGEGRRPDIRFVRQPGPATVVTLGRQEGPQGRHIQLVGPTVSRQHARMRFSGGRWTIANLSQTNPLRVNGRPLGSAAETHMLSDGDRVEVGELVLVFRER